jgi:hypothetical protein
MEALENLGSGLLRTYPTYVFALYLSVIGRSHPILPQCGDPTLFSSAKWEPFSNPFESPMSLGLANFNIVVQLNYGTITNSNYCVVELKMKFKL